MIIVIHGDDVASSTKKLDEFLKSPWVVRLDGKKINPDDIQKSFATESLFTEKKVVIIENIKNATKISLDSIIDHANKEHPGVTLVIYHTDTLDVRIIKKFSKPTVFEFKLPKVYFQFLDGLYPGNSRSAHMMLMDLSKSYTPEQIFYSLVKRFRTLLMLSTGNASIFDEIGKMNDWQLIKLRTQVARWDREDLVRIYKKLYELEKGMKTSTLSTTLLSHIDIIILSEL